MATKHKSNPITRDDQFQPEGTSPELDSALAEVNWGARESFPSLDDWAWALDDETN